MLLLFVGDYLTSDKNIYTMVYKPLFEICIELSTGILKEPKKEY